MTLPGIISVAVGRPRRTADLMWVILLFVSNSWDRVTRLP